MSVRGTENISLPVEAPPNASDGLSTLRSCFAGDTGVVMGGTGEEFALWAERCSHNALEATLNFK